ncbi:MAG: csn, partial [Variovorax sp.]|nr:csn [Variovorax sp.]
ANAPITRVENLNDGRGYTCGWAGFTTADEEVVAVVEEYTRLVGHNHLAALLPTLSLLNWNGSKSTVYLDNHDFTEHWGNACSNPAFHAAYATVVDRLFGVPAQKHCDELGLKLPVAYAILFDSVVQHGNDKDPDGVPAMIGRVNSWMHHTNPKERVFLEVFLEVRRQTLMNPSNTETRDEWRKSVARVDALEGLLRTNPMLSAPVRVECADWKVTL